MMGDEDIQLEILQLHGQHTDHKTSLCVISEFLQRSVVLSETHYEGSMKLKQIVRLLFSLSIGSDLKKGILKCIVKVPQKWYSGVFEEISACLSSSFLENFNDYATVRSRFESVSVFLSNDSIKREFIISNFSRITMLYENTINIMSVQLNKEEQSKIKEIEISEVLHLVVQTMIVFVDESCKCKSSIKFSRTLYESIRTLMSCRKLSVNTINNCGLLVVQLDYHFFDASSSLSSLKEISECSPIQRLAICHGYLASSSLESYITSCSDNCNLIVIISDFMWRVYLRHASDSLIVIGILKVVLLFSKKINFRKYHLPERCTKRLIDLLLSHLDHFLNPAKNLSKEALNQIILQKDDLVISEFLNFIKVHRRVDRKSCVILSALSSVVKFSQIIYVHETIIEDLRSSAKNVVSANYVCQVYLSLMICHYADVSIDEWFDIWMKPLLIESLNFSLLLEYVLIRVAKLTTAVFPRIIEFCQTVDDNNYSVVIKCISEMKACNSSYYSDLSVLSQLGVKSTCWKNLIPYEMMEEAIRVPSAMDAIKTASLIIESVKEKEKFTVEEINLLKFFIDSQFAVDKRDFRCKFLKLQLQMIAKISRYHTSSDPSWQSKHISDFIEWIARYCVNNLFAGASYARRHTALQICQILIDVNLWPASCIDLRVVKIFLSCLRDTFEENERTANIILIKFSYLKPDLVSVADRINLYLESIEMLNSCRVSEHNTAGYLLEMLCGMSPLLEYLDAIVMENGTADMLECSKVQEICEEDVYLTHLRILTFKLKSQLNNIKDENIIKFPLHGFLHVIRQLLDRVPLKNQSTLNIVAWKVVINELIHVSISCNQFAVNFVSHSSPEGYLPDEEYDEDDTFNLAQQTLLCNWRTIKGASLLLGNLVENFSVCSYDNDEAYLYKSTFLQIGDHLKTLIYKIRHKGSFKQVYIALFQYCKRCWKSLDCEVNILPKRWLKEIELNITNNGKQLCLTRRSAGIPCIVLAILCTEFDDKSKFKSGFLNKFMKKMFEILDDENVEIESKIHALNILRDLFIHRDMADEIDSYVEKAVVIAINGFKSSNWNERNTSNLLLSAILTRVFGVARSRTEISWKNKMTGKMFFQKYPRLFDIFRNLLQKNQDEIVDVHSALYPLLLIFARLYPSYHDEWNETFQPNVFIPYIYNCSGNSVFKIRQLTVQAIIPFITRDIYVSHMRKVWSHLMLPLSENGKHGLLLQLDGLLQNMPELDEKQSDDLVLLAVQVLSEANIILGEHYSFVIKEKLLTILSIFLKQHHRVIDFSKIESHLVCKSALKTNQYRLNERNFIVASSAFKIGLQYLSSLKRGNPNEFVNELENMLEHENNENDLGVVLEFVAAIFSDEKCGNENLIVQNFVSTISKKETKEVLLESKIIYRYILNKLSENDIDKVFKVLHILPEYFERCWEDDLVEVLSSFCDKYSRNGRLMEQFLNCLHALVKKQVGWKTEYATFLKTLFSTSEVCLNYRRKLKRFFFKYCSCDIVNSDELLALNVWTLIAEEIPNIDEEDFIFFKETLRHSKYEDHLLPCKLIEKFCFNFQSKPLICCVGLISWVIRDIGVTFCYHEKNNVFSGDLPDYFEDHLLLCQLSTKRLNVLLKRNVQILDQEMPKFVASWLCRQGGFKETEVDVSLSTLREVITFVILRGETRWQTLSESSKFISSKSDSVKEEIMKSKFFLLLSLLKCDDQE